MSIFTLSLAHVIPAHAELQAREIGTTGIKAFYDTTLNVTWLDIASGYKNWDTANAWVSSLNPGGLTGWRLPTMTVTNPNAIHSFDGTTAVGFNVSPSSSEMASLFFDTLGNKAHYDTSGNSPQTGWGLANKGGFQNLQALDYWLGTEYASNSNQAWYFDLDFGFQNATTKYAQFAALAVRAGDISPAPEPEIYLMLLLGLGLVGAVSRRHSLRCNHLPVGI